MQERIRRARLNKSHGRDDIQYEILKLEVPLLAKMILEIWNLIGRTGVYSNEWRVGLRTQIYKKGDPCISVKYLPICMFSCPRKVLEAALAEKILKTL